MKQGTETVAEFIVEGPTCKSNEQRPRHSPEAQELRTIVDNMACSTNALRKQYGDDLLTSLEALVGRQASTTVSQRLAANKDIRPVIKDAQGIVKTMFQTICDSLVVEDSRHKWLNAGLLWPCLTPVTLLENLRPTRPTPLGMNMKKAILEYEQAITILQHILRVNDAQTKNDSRRLHEELANLGHKNWKVDDYSD